MRFQFSFANLCSQNLLSYTFTIRVRHKRGSYETGSAEVKWLLLCSSRALLLIADSPPFLGIVPCSVTAPASLTPSCRFSNFWVRCVRFVCSVMKRPRFCRTPIPTCQRQPSLTLASVYPHGLWLMLLACSPPHPLHTL